MMRASNIKSIVALLVASSILVSTGGSALAASGAPGVGSYAGYSNGGSGNGSDMGYGRGYGGDNIVTEAPPVVDDGLYRWVDIVNHADQPIYYVQISNIDDPYYGTDVLGPDNVIGGHAEARVEPRNHNGYCRFDILLTYKDGTEVAIRDVDLCRATDILAWDNGTFDVVYVG